MASETDLGQAQGAPLNDPPLSPSPAGRRFGVGMMAVIIIGLLMGLAAPTVGIWLAILAQRPWGENIPQLLTCCFLILALWQAKTKPVSPDSLSLLRPDAGGFIVLGLSGVVYVLSLCLSIKVGMFISLIALTASLCLTMGGRALFRRCVPGFLFALFLLPQFPTDMRTAISLPLQLISTQLATGLAAAFIPIKTLGNIFYIRGEAFEVTVACSGLNTWVGYLFAGMLGLLMGHFSWGRLGRLLLAAPLLALGENAIRLWITALVAYWVSPNAGMAIHTNLEFFLFPLGLWVMVRAEQAFQARFGRTSQNTAASLDDEPSSAISSPLAPETPPQRDHWGMGAIAGITISLLALINLGVWLGQASSPVGPFGPFGPTGSSGPSVSPGERYVVLPPVPYRVGSWHGQGLPFLHDEAAILAPAVLTSREYTPETPIKRPSVTIPGSATNTNTNTSERPLIWLNLLEATSMNALHNVVDSLIASGAKPTLRGVLTIPTRKGPLKASWYHCVDETGKPYHLLLWYEWAGGNADNRWLWYWHVLKLKLQKQEPTWRLVEISTPGSAMDDSPEQARKLAQLKRFAAEIYPLTVP